MGRCGYSDDLDQKDLAMWRGRVASAMRGNRGQKLLRDCLAALDDMPEKRLIKGELVDPEGQVCLLGAAGRKRNIADIDKIDSEEHGILASKFDVAECLIQEIEYINDEDWQGRETPEQTFDRVHKWLVDSICLEA